MSKSPARKATYESLLAQGRSFGATDKEVRQIHNLIKRHKLPPDVHSFEVNFGLDWTGDPALFINFMVDNDNNPPKQKLVALNQFARSVRSDLLEADLRFWPYVNFRAVS